MRLWKCVVLGLLLCMAVLLLITRNTLSTHSQPSGTFSSSSSPSSHRQRVTRAAGGFEVLLTELREMLTQRAGRGRSRVRRRARPCALRQVEVSVGHLGLGYDSDETLLFRYCSGRCDARRRNYDVSLQFLKGAGALRERSRARPCCRPTAYDAFSFLDNANRYYTIRQLSARECACV